MPTSSEKSDLVVVEALGTGNGLALLRAALDMGIKTTFLTQSVQRYRHDLDREVLSSENPLLHIVEGVDVTDRDVLAAEISRHGTASCGVIAQVDKTVLPTAEACHTLGRRFQLPAVVRLCAKKAELRRTLATAGISTVNWLVATEAADTEKPLAEFVSANADVVVVKPNQGTGSIGVKLCWGYQHAVEAINEILAAGGEALVEEYIPGALVSVEVFRDQGTTLILGTTDRVLSDPPYFAELNWTFPTQLDPDTRAELDTIVSQILDEIAFDNGPAHVEFILSKDGPKVVEVNPRMAGRGLSRMVSDISGTNEYVLVIRNALGLDIADVTGEGASDDIYASECVIVGPRNAAPSAAALQIANELPGVVHVRLGDPSAASHAYGDKYDLGEVRALGPTFAQAQMFARSAAQLVSSSF